MANNNIEKLTISFIKRNARQRGPTQSAAWNDQGEELAQDLTNVSTQWNSALVPLLSTIPDGDNDLDAFTNGLDGRTLYVNSSVTAADNSVYWNTGSSRPNSLKEQVDNLYTLINNSVDDLQSLITSSLPAASEIQIKDSGNLYDSTNVEDALQEVMGLAQSISISASDIDKLNQLTLTGQNTFGASMFFTDGTVSAPSIARSSNHQTGFYFSGNALHYSYNNSNVLTLDNTGLSVSAITPTTYNMVSSGSTVATVEGYPWSANPAALQGIRIDGVTSGLSVAIMAAANGILYAWDPVSGSSGGFRSDNFSNGTASFSVDASGNIIANKVSFPDGSQGAPSVTFAGATNTGMWRSGGGNIVLGVAGTISCVVGSNFMAIGNLVSMDVINGSTLNIDHNITTPLSTPSSSSATGVTGTIKYDTGFIYICTATNTWKRVALSTF